MALKRRAKNLELKLILALSPAVHKVLHPRHKKKKERKQTNKQRVQC